MRIIIREAFAHPDNFGKVSFPGSSAARPSGVRPDIRGTALRYDDDEESEELDEEQEEVEELDTTLPEYLDRALVLEVLNTTLHKEVISRSCSAYVCRDQEIGPVTIPSIGVEGAF